MPRTIFWIIAILVFVEAGLEYRASRRGYETIIFGVQAPPSAKPDQTGDETFGVTPSFPFRSRVAPVSRTPGIPRIWFASASYGEDLRVDAASIFPNLVGERLHLEVLNASRAGYTIARNTQILREEGPVWQPDVVVLYQLFMDVLVISKRLREDPQGHAAEMPTAAPRPVSPPKKGPNPLTHFCQRTTIFQTIREMIGGRINQQRILADHLGAGAPQMLRTGLEAFIAACRELGARPVLCTFAAASDRHNYQQATARARTQLFNQDIGLSLLGWVNAVDELNDEIRAVARDNDLQIIDVAARFGGHAEYFGDFIHFNRDGHEALGEFMATELDSALSGISRPGNDDEF